MREDVVRSRPSFAPERTYFLAQRDFRPANLPSITSSRRETAGKRILPGAQNVRSIRMPLDDLGLGIPIHGQPQNEVEAFVRHIFEGSEKQRRHA
jgi:hypothetical protein